MARLTRVLFVGALAVFMKRNSIVPDKPVLGMYAFASFCSTFAIPGKLTMAACALPFSRSSSLVNSSVL